MLLDELIDLVKKMQVQKEKFFSDDPLIPKLKEWQEDLSKRKKMSDMIKSKKLLTHSVPEQAQPLFNLINQLLKDPQFLTHQRSPLIFSKLRDPQHFEKILLYIVEQPVVPEIVSDVNRNNIRDEIAVLNDDYLASKALLHNHLCTFVEKNELGLAANSLLINVTTMCEDLYPPVTSANACTLI